MSSRSVTDLSYLSNVWMKTFAFFHNLKEMNDIWLENKLKVYVNQSKICVRFTDID